MKSVLCYNPYWSSFGGGEKYFLTLAESIARISDTNVALLSNDKRVKKSELERFFNLDLSKIEFKEFEGDAATLKNLTKNAELFLCLSNFRSFPSASRKRAQVLQIPYGKIGAGSVAEKLVSGKLKEAAKDIFRKRLLADAREKTDLVLVYSQFVANALESNHGVKCTVLSPPIQDFALAGIPKKKIILSAGRFFSGLYNNKRYDILTQAFRAASPQLTGWEYHLAGSYAPDPATDRMLASLQNDNRDFPVHFHLNEPYDSLRQLYNEATVFWHAAGYGIDEVKHPENAEHFGMTTVEAMSAGCIPVVINCGGQKEIVAEDMNGFLWKSIDDLVSQTVRVANLSEERLLELRRNARIRYEGYSLNEFRRQVIDLFTPLLD